MVKKRLFFRAGFLYPATLFISLTLLGFSQHKSVCFTDGFVQMRGACGSVIKCEYDWGQHKYKTYILTAFHVLDSKTKNKVTFPQFDKHGRQVSRKSYGSNVILCNEKIDFAVLLVYTDTYIKPITINISEINLMDEVYLVGRPMGTNLWITRGQIANLNTDSKIGAFGHTAATYFGNSGGPCVNSHGEQIGIVSGAHSKSDLLVDILVPHMGFCLAVKTIKEYYPTEFEIYFSNVKQ